MCWGIYAGGLGVDNFGLV